ncbi:hypothetical protein [Pusillimonas sp.]|uniref:hypothetical protein n=1 Tax=Pusillimonas sp. TaxID=3040095 RepID=UPI0037CB739C
MTSQKLPPAFADLEPFMDWAQPTEFQRLQKREESTMEAIKAFYDAAQPKAAAAIEHFHEVDEKTSQGHAEPDAETMNLYTLMLGLAEASLAIEVHGSTTVPDGLAWHVWKPEHETSAWQQKPKAQLFPAG